MTNQADTKRAFTDAPEFVDLFDLYGVMLREEASDVRDALTLYGDVLNVELAALSTKETRYTDAAWGDDAEDLPEAVAASWRTMAKARLIAAVENLDPAAVEAVADPSTDLTAHLTKLAFATEAGRF